MMFVEKERRPADGSGEGSHFLILKLHRNLTKNGFSQEKRRKCKDEKRGKEGGREKAPAQGRDGGILCWKIFITVG